MELPIGEVASNSLLFGFDQVLWLHNGTLYLHSLKSLFYSWPKFSFTSQSSFRSCDHEKITIFGGKVKVSCSKRTIFGGKVKVSCLKELLLEEKSKVQ